MSLLGSLANQEINNFLRTVTIKNDCFATRSRNRQLRINNKSVPDNLVPYYRHIAGEYILKEAVTCRVKNPKTGQYETQTYGATSQVLNGNGSQTTVIDNVHLYMESAFDEMMYVTSLDTGEEIPFTLENLHPEFAASESAVHTKTRKAYMIPSRLHDLLCEKYPTQVDLIKAIEYPVKAVRGITELELDAFNTNGEPLPDYARRRREAIAAAEDFTLLSCDENLLEEAERHDLISHVKRILHNLDKRWNIEEFWKEQNYPIVLWSLVWCALRLGLIVRRYENIRTQFVHSSHVWDYLLSKGMKDYRDILTPQQVKFLYKNIEYIIRNRGKQKVTNILADEFLTSCGIDLKTKTIVLDTTKTLDASNVHKIDDVATQCEKCSRQSYCHKKITYFACPNYLNLEGLCEAEPVVLTEEFIGARKSKVIESLIKQHGYTEDEANTKYERANIWWDDEVESIKEDYDRTQLTDVSGQIESLDTLIQREYATGIEPEYTKQVVEEQTNELQHIVGTVAPTKLIELTRNKTNPKYAALFNKFLTETLLHLAPRLYTYTDGDLIGQTVRVDKVAMQYGIAFTDVNMNCSLSYGELLALMYMGIIKEHMIDLFFDHCSADQKYRGDRQYFRIGKWDEDNQEELPTIINGLKIVPLKKGDYVIGTEMDQEDVYLKVDGNYVECQDATFDEGTEYYKKVGQDSGDDSATLDDQFKLMEPGDWVDQQYVGPDVYQWAPYKYGFQTPIDLCAGHDPLTDFLNKWTYEFPVPGQLRMTNSFKFIKPVLQEELVNAWYTDLDTDIDYGDYIPRSLKMYYKQSSPSVEVKAVSVRGVVYVVSEIGQDPPTIWDGWPIALRIDGVIKYSTYFPALDEVGIIPKYARWYPEHLKADSLDVATETEQVITVDTDIFPLDEKQAEVELPDEVKGDELIKYDANKGKQYTALEISQYFDVDSFLNDYVDLPESVTTQEQLGEYITKMFTLMERVYGTAEAATKAEVQVVCRAVLDACLMNTRKYRFDLVGLQRTTKWVPDGVSQYPIEYVPADQEEGRKPVSVVLYNTWLSKTENLMSICQAIDSNPRASIIWSQFNADSSRKVLDGCTLSYVETASSHELAKKLRQLVTSLSSYKVTFIDSDDTDRNTDQLGAILTGDASRTVDITSRDYVSPTMDSTCGAHLECYETTSSGCIMMRTPDTHALKDKVYYKLANVQQVSLDLDDRPFQLDENGVISYSEHATDESGVPYLDLVDELDLDRTVYEPAELEEGTLLEPNSYYEMVDVRQALQVSGLSTVVEFAYNGTWACRVGVLGDGSKIIPTYSNDEDATITVDEFISSLRLEETKKKKLVVYKARKLVGTKEYGWTAWMDIPPALAPYMSNFMASRTIYVHDSTEFDIISESGHSTTDDQYNDDDAYGDLIALRQNGDSDPVPMAGEYIANPSTWVPGHMSDDGLNTWIHGSFPTSEELTNE